jgi:ferredoxin/flavodoxin
LKTTLYYFTGTGNSLHVAKSLAGKLGHCDLIPIVTVLREEKLTINSDVVGIICPMHCQSAPKIVEDFVMKADFHSVSYIFVVFTRGAAWSSGGITQLRTILKKRGYSLSAGFYITMINNVLLWHNLAPWLVEIPTQERVAGLQQKIDRKTTYIKEIIQVQKKIIDKEKKLASLTTPMMRMFYKKNVNKLDKYFKSTDNCNSCGLCVKVCPLNNIRLETGKPIWLHQCAFCFACINYCPQKSIYINKATRDVIRYRNPTITIEEIIKQKE